MNKIFLGWEGESTLVNQVKEYYTDYYRDQLGLKNWSAKVATRLNEEKCYGINWIEFLRDKHCFSFKDKRILIIGCGTGGDLVNFVIRGADCYGFDISKKAVDITREKLRVLGSDSERVMVCDSASIPYPSDYFDLVWCISVLEHVGNPDATVEEATRVLKVGGIFFIHTPNPNQMWEPHYKIPISIRLPRFFLKIYIRLSGRNPKFLDSLNVIEPSKLMKKLESLGHSISCVGGEAPRFTSGCIRNVVIFLQRILYFKFGQNFSTILLCHKVS